MVIPIPISKCPMIEWGARARLPHWSLELVIGHSLQITQCARVARVFLSITRTLWPSATTSERGGTLWVRKTLAPMVEPAPMTVSPPMIVVPA